MHYAQPIWKSVIAEKHTFAVLFSSSPLVFAGSLTTISDGAIVFVKILLYSGETLHS